MSVSCNPAVIPWRARAAILPHLSPIRLDVTGKQQPVSLLIFAEAVQHGGGCGREEGEHLCGGLLRHLLGLPAVAVSAGGSRERRELLALDVEL